MASVDSRLLGVVTPGVYVAISLRGRSSSAESVARRLDGPTRHDAGHGRAIRLVRVDIAEHVDAGADLPDCRRDRRGIQLGPAERVLDRRRPVRRVGDPGDRDADVVDLAAAVRGRPARRPPRRRRSRTRTRAAPGPCTPTRTSRTAPGSGSPVRSSSAPSAVLNAPSKNSPIGMTRSPRGAERATTSASSASSRAGMSEAGSAWAIPPPIVPRLRTWRSAIRGSASAMSSSCVTVGSASSCAYVVSAPIASRPSGRARMPRSSSSRPMSISRSGRARRSFMRGSRLWPPARIFASCPWVSRSASASSTLLARS